ncbi:chorismate mutase [Nocardia sp. NPDC050799]|uniref:chorismate mutase n=1 Tax=Nocardia sp. NPDC050799 TaxID=3154842 RepID=UPI0033FBED75
MTSDSPSAAVTANASFGRLGGLIDLAVERLRVSNDVAASKFGTGSAVDDPVREQQVLDRVRSQAAAIGLDPNTAAAFFQDQITASKVVQNGLLAHWKAHPDQAPDTRPDLARIRVQLDQLTGSLLEQLRATVDVRTTPAWCAIELPLAAESAALLDGLDILHQQALGTAVRSVCSTG